MSQSVAKNFGAEKTDIFALLLVIKGLPLFFRRNRAKCITTHPLHLRWTNCKCAQSLKWELLDLQVRLPVEGNASGASVTKTAPWAHSQCNKVSENGDEQVEATLGHA